MSRNAEDDLKVVDAFWPSFTSNELAEICAHFSEVGGFEREVRPGGRPLTRSALIQAGHGAFFVKWRSGHTLGAEGLFAEHQLIRHLRAAGFPTPALIPTTAGETALAWADGWVEVQACAEGEDRYAGRHTWQPFLSPSDARAVGRSLAGLHRLTADLPVPTGIDRGCPAATPTRLSNPFPGSDPRAWSSHPEVQAFLAARPNWSEGIALLQPGWNEVAAELMDLPQGWIHGDPQANNHFFQGEDVAAVIDFHLATVAPRLLDLAIALDRNGLMWLEIMAGSVEAWDEPSLRGLLSGYGPLTPAEAQLLPRLLPLAQVDFALSLLTYYLTIERSEARAAWAWDVFVVGHAQWHASACGQRFLAELTGWISDVPGRSSAPGF